MQFLPIHTVYLYILYTYTHYIYYIYYHYFQSSKFTNYIYVYISYHSFIHRSFAEGAFKPDISTHGPPRRTIVLTLSETGLFLFKHCLIRLAQSCTQLAINSETAVTAKATARGKPASTVPHIKYLLKLSQPRSFFILEKK